MYGDRIFSRAAASIARAEVPLVFAGGGFSGYWYYHGFLSGLSDADAEFSSRRLLLGYSAGALAIAFFRLGIPVATVVNAAEDARTLRRTSVVPC